MVYWVQKQKGLQASRLVQMAMFLSARDTERVKVKGFALIKNVCGMCKASLPLNTTYVQRLKRKGLQAPRACTSRGIMQKLQTL